MTRRIPPNLIEHLEWKPGLTVPPLPSTPPAGNLSNTRSFTIEEIIDWYRPFYSEDKDSDNRFIGVAVALREALDYTMNDGIILTMPELIAAKIAVGKEHEFWNNWYTTHTEENIGIDKSGIFVLPGEPVLVVVHGGGLLTPDVIMDSYEKGLVEGSAAYDDDKFTNFLRGELPDGTTLPIYRLDDIKDTAVEVRKYGIVLPYVEAQATTSGYHKETNMIKNPLAIARAGSLDNLKKYFDLAKDHDDEVGNWHVYSGRDPTQAQGRLLFLDDGNGGLLGSGYLKDDGRFVGVSAGGARRARGK